jgi:23S rRNA (uracil1939-C5)-methyltransferase
MPDSESLAVDIIDLTHDGKGVADVEGRRVFVPDALPGERALVRPGRKRRRYREATLREVLTSASARVEPACPYFGVCGGCAIQHMSSAAQVDFKQKVAEETLARIGGVRPLDWLEPVSGPQWNYRRRARLGVRWVPRKGRVLVGFRERSAAYITDMAHCRVLAKPMDRALGDLAGAIGRTSIPHRIPQIEVAIGENRAAIVVRVLDPPNSDDRAILLDFGKRHAVDVYMQPGGPGTVEPLESGIPALRYTLPDFDLEFEFTPMDFVQVNAAINGRMVADAVEHAEICASDRVLDLFCGLGNFSLPFAGCAGELLGVEGDAGLVARAVHNARLNRIDNARFVTADLAEEGWSFLQEPWDVVVLDPPRTGAQPAITCVAKLRPRKIVYVSCHPGTLARDARILLDSGTYRLSSARVFDMFPNTHHVELMAVFERSAA